MKPRLACEANLKVLKFPVLASPKLDSVRAIIRDGGGTFSLPQSSPPKTFSQGNSHD